MLPDYLEVTVYLEFPNFPALSQGNPFSEGIIPSFPFPYSFPHKLSVLTVRPTPSIRYIGVSVLYTLFIVLNRTQSLFLYFTVNLQAHNFLTKKFGIDISNFQ